MPLNGLLRLWATALYGSVEKQGKDSKNPLRHTSSPRRRRRVWGHYGRYRATTESPG
jgi:hypothetical protein